MLAGGDNSKAQVSHAHTTHGLEGFRAVIYYLHDYIPFGQTKDVISPITSEANARDAKRELNRFSNKMTPADNPDAAVAPFPHVLIHSQIRAMERERE